MPSEANKVIPYEVLVSKSGFSLNIRIFSLVRLKLAASIPPNVRESISSSTSETDTLVTNFWFSGIDKVDAISIEGSSLTGEIVTTTSALEVLSPWIIV